MPSATEPTQPPHAAPRSQLRRTLERYNRQLHYFSGLFLLFFLWLFALSGLLLNHPSWKFTEFWTNRKEQTYQRPIALPTPAETGDLAQAHSLMRQLNVEGEILWTTTRADTNIFEFQVRRPGHYLFLKADFTQKTISVRQAEVNQWGVIKALHSFTGASLDDPRNRRDWTLTAIWAYTMDAVALGLILMIATSLYMWWNLPEKRLPGAASLLLGFLLCALFTTALRSLYK